MKWNIIWNSIFLCVIRFTVCRILNDTCILTCTGIWDILKCLSTQFTIIMCAFLTLLFTLTVNYFDMSLYTIPRYCYYRWCFRTGSVKVVPNSWSLIWPGTSSLSMENTPQSHRITSDCRFYLMSVPFLFLCITNSFHWYSKKIITCIFINIFGITATV